MTVSVSSENERHALYWPVYRACILKKAHAVLLYTDVKAVCITTNFIKMQLYGTAACYVAWISQWCPYANIWPPRLVCVHGFLQDSSIYDCRLHIIYRCAKEPPPLHWTTRPPSELSVKSNYLVMHDSRPTCQWQWLLTSASTRRQLYPASLAQCDTTPSQIASHPRRQKVA